MRWRGSRFAAPEFTSQTIKAMIQPRRAAYSRIARFCEEQRKCFARGCMPVSRRMKPVWPTFRDVTHPRPQTILFGQVKDSREE
jgi:hypothetical protein